MKTMKGARSKKSQYIIGSVIAVIILLMWVSFPLINKSAMDSSVPSSGGFSKRSADLSLLADGSGASAPGSPLTGELTDNPATTLDLAASALFNSGVSQDGQPKEQTASGDSTVSGSPVPNIPSPGAPGGSGAGPKGKLNVLPSLTAGNSGSSTIGAKHDKFFGGETAKADFNAAPAKMDIKANNEKTSAILASLKNVEEKSLKAASSSDPNASRSGASSAFENNKKVDTGELNGDLENKVAQAGLELGKVDQDLKKNDPSINKKKIDLPTPKPQKDESDQDAEFKKMIIQMIIQATVGQMFGAMGQMMATSINPNYKPGGAN